jgi:flavin-dependent dehydrogenase
MKKKPLINYDVIIIGAGPAGLYFAKELGKEFKVLVVEKKKNICHNKFWVSWKENVLRNNISDCVRYIAPKGHFRYHKNPDIKFTDAFCWIINPQKVMSKWLKEMPKKVSFLFKTEFIGYKIKGEKVRVITNKKSFDSKLLIDASGFESKIARKKRNIIERLICSNYAAEVEGLNLGKEAIVLGILYHRHPPVFYEYFPLKKNRAILEICVYSQKAIETQVLKKDFALHLKRLQRFNLWNAKKKDNKIVRVKPLKYLGGYLPLNKIKSRAFDRVLLVGDAGSWPPRLSGGGFNAILSHGRAGADKLVKLIKFDQLDKESLNGVIEISALEKKNREIQDILAYFICRASACQLKRLFKVLQNLPGGIVSNFIRLEMTDRQIAKTLKALGEEFTLLEFAKIIPFGLRPSTIKGFWVLLRSFIRGRI